MLLTLNMRYHGVARSALLAALMAILSSGCTRTTKSEDAKQIMDHTQELFDAVALGNKGPWNRYIADDVMYFDERGNTMNKAALVSTIEPLPAGIAGKN